MIDYLWPAAAIVLTVLVVMGVDWVRGKRLENEA